MHVKLSPVLQIVRGIIKTLETSFPHAITEPALDLQKPGRSCSVGNAGAVSDTESSVAFHEV
jgi:hypothetical protein